MNSLRHTSTVRNNSPRVHRSHDGGFTLVELLVVIGIISLLVTLLLPSITSARKSSQRTAGVINMRSISTLITNYADNAKGILYNPLVTHKIAGFGSHLNGQFTSDGFMAYAASTLIETTSDTRGRVEQTLSPADGGLQKRYLNARVKEEVSSTNATWPSSFYYSPTMFRDRKRFITMDEPYRKPGMPSACHDATLNMLSDIAFPSAKVVLYERADFTTPTRARHAIGGAPRAEAMSPAFNSPKANVNVMTADGSAALVRSIELMELANVGLQTGNWTYVPVDHLPIPDEMPLLGPDLSELRPDHGSSIDYINLPNSDEEYLYLFAGTRDGVRGRDLQR